MMELLASLERTGFASWLRESGSIWGYPTVLTLHTLGLGVLVGASTVIDLRLLGAASQIPLAPLERLFPIMWAGFWVNAISGVALFAADATTKGTTSVFMAKLVIIVLAVAVLRSIKRSVYRPGQLDARQPVGVKALAAVDVTPPVYRAIAIVSMVSWFFVIYWGRMLPFVGNAF